MSIPAWTPVVVIAVILSLAATVTPTLAQSDSEADHPQKEIERLRKENTALRQRVAELEQRLATLTQRNEQLTQRKQALEQQTTERASEQRAYYLDSTYDADADRTRITSRLIPLRTERGNQWRHHRMRLEAVREGQPGAPGAVRHVRLRLEAFATGRIYDRVEAITLTGKDTRVAAEVVEYDNQFRISGGSRNRRRVDDETLVAEITPDELRQLAAASEVTGRIGTRTFQLARDHIRAMRALQGELTESD